MTQYPIAGKKGKAWSVTAYMGWRIHPVTHVRKYHTGTDIIATDSNATVEAFHDGSVIEVGYQPAGYGNFVVLRHKIDGKFYTSMYGHMKAKSKCKVGQHVKAGDALGTIGTTGVSTGIHLHWEIQIGRFHVYNALGVGFLEPTKFAEKLMAKEKR